jgi:cation:H+ antiporter
MTAVLFCIGLVLLVGGAEVLVRGAARLASAVGVSPLVIGLTVVAFGTSSPELAVSLIATAHGQADIAIGNVVGSNIFNVLFILGVSALVAPLAVSRQLVRLDVPIMIGVSFLLLGMALDGSIGRVDGVLLTVAIAAYTIALIRLSRREQGVAPAAASAPAVEVVPRRGAKALLLDAATVLVGLALLVVGSQWLVDGAIVFARRLGVNELVIGLTIIAAGTSLPELATSVLATIRGERDIAVGNVVGSNIYNILAILGVCGLIAPNGVPVAPAALTFDIPVMTAVAVACLPIFFSGHTISRWEGSLFLAYYVAYTVYLVLSATEHAALPVYGEIMLVFVLPITVITLVLAVLRERRARR